MKRKGKGKLILLLLCLASLFIMGGCSLRNSFDDLLAENNLVAKVTYYANGGSFDKNPKLIQKDLYYQEGVTPLDLDPENIKTPLVRNGYVFDGWYYAVVDDEGNLQLEGDSYKLGAKVDFTVPLQTGDHWQVVAKWLADVTVKVQLVIEGGVGEIPVAVAEGEDPLFYSNGQIVQTRRYNTANQVVNPGDGKEPFKMKGKEYTFTEYYEDKACTKLVQWPLVKGENQTKDETVYAKYIVGDWTVIRNALALNDMFGEVSATDKYYFVKDVDATDISIAPIKGAFKAEIQGNGKVIKNLSVSAESLTTNTASTAVSLFGNIKQEAKIENLTFENLTVSYKAKSTPLYAYFVFTSLDERATINNVNISGTMTLKASNQEGLIAQLFGGYASDDAYITQSGGTGFIVNGTKDEIITYTK